jgi:Helix-turn-helix
MRSADLIREARLRAGLTQYELAERCGRDRSVIARWEQGTVARRSAGAGPVPRGWVHPEPLTPMLVTDEARVTRPARPEFDSEVIEV